MEHAEGRELGWKIYGNEFLFCLWGEKHIVGHRHILKWNDWLFIGDVDQFPFVLHNHTMSYPAVIASFLCFYHFYFYFYFYFFRACSIVLKFLNFPFSSCLFVIAKAKADPCLPHCSIWVIFALMDLQTTSKYF